VTGSPIGFVVYDRDSKPDPVLREVVRRLEVQRVRVRGLLQHGEQNEAAVCATMTLEDIGTGRRVQIFERRGHETRGCRLDPSGLAEAAVWVRESIEARPEILFINRFGRQEAEGRGLVDEIGAALSADIPTIIPVGRALLPDWEEFAGGEGMHLPNDADGLEAWCLSHLARLPPA